MITNLLNATERKLAQELAEAEFSTAAKVGANLVKSDSFNWQVIHEAKRSGLAEAVRQELAGSEGHESLTPQHDRAFIPLKNTPGMG